jgi:hypothetical protein
MEPLFIPIVIVVFAAVAILSMKNRQARLEAWRAFSAKHSLNMISAGSWSNPRLVGRFRGLDVTLQIEVHGSGKHKKTYTRASARFPMPMPRGLNITSEGFTDRLAKLVGGQDIELGIPKVDNQLRIKGEDVPAVLDLMENWRARDAITAFLTRDPKATVTQHQVSILRAGFVSAPVEMRGMLEGVCRPIIEIRKGLEENAGDGQSAIAPPPLEEEPAGERARFDWEPAVESVDTAHGYETSMVSTSTVEIVESSVVIQDGVVLEHRQERCERDALEDAFFGGGEAEVIDLAVSPVGEQPAPAPARPEPGTDSAFFAPGITPEPSPPASPTEASAPSPPAGALPLERLSALEGMSAGEARDHARALVGARFDLELEVERVSLTMGMRVPPAVEGGYTVVGKPAGEAGPRLSIRFPKSATSTVSSLGYGDRLPAAARFVSWDDFYRQAVMDAL